MIDQYILEAIQALIASVSTLPVKYIGVNMQPPSDEKWIELVHIPNNIENEFWNSGKTYQGFTRIILHWPQDGSGTSSPMTALTTIETAFYKGRLLQDAGSNVTVKIIDTPNFLGPIEDSPNMLYPLSVRYSFFKP